MRGRGKVWSPIVGSGRSDPLLTVIDPYYAEVVQPDEEAFFDFANSKFTLGWEETYVDASKDGEVAESVAGKS